jgi:NADPH:quinone reductase-like Zn-dependent oxidoreductase
MKSIIAPRYGGPEVLQHVDAPTPAPGEGQVLVRVAASSVNPLEWHIMRGKPYLVRLVRGIPQPRSSAIGSDVAGTVEAIGTGVTRFVAGDRVFGFADAAWSDFALAPEQSLVATPASLSSEDAAGVGIAAITALQGFQQGGLQVEGATERIASGEQRPRVLINGAAGGVGTFAVQIAKLLGAHVTAITSSRNLALVSRIGADDLIDYTSTDVTTQLARYDLILDLVSNHSRRSLAGIMTPTGTLVFAGAPRGQWLGPLLTIAGTPLASRFSRRTFLVLSAQRTLHDLQTLAAWLGSGALRVVVDQVYPREHVAQAVAHVEAGHARGKVILTLA